MPARGYPIDIEAIILFELVRGYGSGPEVWRRARARMLEQGFKLNSGAWYPALTKLFEKGFVAWAMGESPYRRGKSRIAKIYILTEKGVKEAKRLSTIIRNLLLPPETSK
jgi:DNA-binding PadR family transcriptional regulator